MSAAPDDHDAPEDTEDQWRFSLDEVGPDADADPGPDRLPIEPESPDLEHVVFVLLGVVGTVLLLLSSF